VLKRSALEEVGGVAVETVTEDAHTARCIGAATRPRTCDRAGRGLDREPGGPREQRIRWARGMAQIFRIDNPFVGRGPGLIQRICYGNAMLHFFYGIPRLVFLTIPLAYLFFICTSSTRRRSRSRATWSRTSCSRTSRTRGCRALPPFVLGRSLRVGARVVHRAADHRRVLQPEARQVQRDRQGRQDRRRLRRLVDLEAVSRAVRAQRAGDRGRVVAARGRPGRRGHDDARLDRIQPRDARAALAVARETKQVRVTHRIAMRVPATLLLADGTTAACFTSDYSTGGLGLEAVPGLSLAVGDMLTVCVTRGDRPFPFPVRVSRVTPTHVGVSSTR
jgi:cellulose synthase (UDP-forming)